nr:YdaE family protein [Atlantibacter hermannii]
MIHGQETTGAKCAYCKSPLQPGDEVKSTLLLLRANMLAREERHYCSAQCAGHDQMAHEP